MDWSLLSWNATGKQVRFFIFDGRLAIFVLIWAFHFSYYTAGAAGLAMLFFYALEYKGYNIPNALRKGSVLIAGKKRNGVHWWRFNRLLN